MSEEVPSLCFSLLPGKELIKIARKRREEVAQGVVKVEDSHRNIPFDAIRFLEPGASQDEASDDDYAAGRGSREAHFGAGAISPVRSSVSSTKSETSPIRFSFLDQGVIEAEEVDDYTKKLHIMAISEGGLLASEHLSGELKQKTPVQMRGIWRESRKRSEEIDLYFFTGKKPLKREKTDKETMAEIKKKQEEEHLADAIAAEAEDGVGFLSLEFIIIWVCWFLFGIYFLGFLMLGSGVMMGFLGREDENVLSREFCFYFGIY